MIILLIFLMGSSVKQPAAINIFSMMPERFDHLNIVRSTRAIKKPDTIPQPVSQQILISAGQCKEFTTVTINKVVYQLVVEKTDTVYISTDDRSFATPEGYRVGTRFKSLPVHIQKSLLREPGWGYYYTLPSGWCLGFCEGSSCTKNYPGPMSVIKWIFKRS